ncbi:MAG: helix-turn-helix transcriptional regulator [Ruminococcaceae bacterium]|nr:helix-turn-helix transcriptional regulator [Oscillospiraceae bacterium]
MKWNEKVLELMKRNNVSQKQLSEISGIAESSLSRYLHSDQRPRMDIVINIAKALDIETQYLLEEEETSESAYNYIATAVARKGKELTPEEQNKLIGLILGFEKNV